jgi:hypothetical protein
MLLLTRLAMSASTSRFALESIVLLGVTYIRLGENAKCVSSEIQDLKGCQEEVALALDYNQLKRLLLRTLVDSGPIDSSSLCQRLSASRKDPFEIHAVRMALVRYYRQGLLKRIRSGGEFKYSLSSRGIARLQWLEGQTKDPI